MSATEILAAKLAQVQDRINSLYRTKDSIVRELVKAARAQAADHEQVIDAVFAMPPQGRHFDGA
jgi:hypothetical protein